jgi:hypothetical protein
MKRAILAVVADWGVKVSIKAPPAAAVSTKLDSDQALGLPPGPQR